PPQRPDAEDQALMSESPVRSEQRGKVLLITLDRPKANAINGEVSRALYAAFDRLQRDEGLLVGVLASANERIFSAGWDLKEVDAGLYDPLGAFDSVKGHRHG